MGLTLYRRHLADCDHRHKGRTFKRCHCPIWIQGTWEGRPVRKSLDVTSMERAEEIKRDLMFPGAPVVAAAVAEKNVITIAHAAGSFIADCESRNLSHSTLRKYRTFVKQLTAFVESNALSALADLNTERLRDFRNSWKMSARTAGKQLERLRSFLKFALDNDWIPKNPAKAIKAAQVRTLPRLPFTDKEVANIISKAKDDRELAFILTLRHSGLRIGDASLLKASHLSENRLYLYTAKSGNPVHIVLPGSLISLLKSLPQAGGYFFIRGESTVMHTTADLWRRSIKRMCKDAGVFPDHPHRFRHTLAADLLTKGASVEDVAAILGNSPTIVQKHYAQFVKSRQDRLDEIVAKTWDVTPKLVRVK